MKTINRLLFLLIAFIGLSLTQSCIDNDFETPMDGGYNHGLKENITIAQLKELYTNGNIEIAQDLIVSGYVNSSDEEGNVYKTLYIQDDTGGIPIIIEKNGTYTSYRVGRKVFVKCKGLWLGAYGGMIQLGAVPETEGSSSLGRISETLLGKYLYKDSELTDVVPTTVSIKELDAQKSKLLGQLIKIEGVQFSPYLGLTYSSPDATTDRTLVDKDNNSIILRNSNYATFASKIIPNGSGSITAVLSVYNNKYQLYIRSTDDIKFGPNRLDGSVPGTDPGTNPGAGEGDGSQANPYNIAAAMANQGAANNTDYKWVKGYVVGVYETGSNPFTPSFTAPFTTASNIIIAATPNETDIAKCLTVQLPLGDIRTALSPVSSPAILKKEVKIQGALEAYFSSPGIKNVQAHEADGSSPGPDPGTGEGDGSQASPYSITAAKTNQGAVGNTDYKWVKGYVVGVYETGSNPFTPSFAAPFTTASNIIIAASPSETDMANCLTVQLPVGEIRTALSPVSSPTILKKEVKIQGALEAYFSSPGIKSIQAYETDGSSPGPNPNPDPGTGEGSQANPYNIATAITSQGSSVVGWIEGYIVGVTKSGVTSISSAADVVMAPPFTGVVATNVILADNASETDYTKCVVVNLPSGSNLRTQVNLLDNSGSYGKKLKVKGTLRTYFGIPGLRDVADGNSDFELGS